MLTTTIMLTTMDTPLVEFLRDPGTTVGAAAQFVLARLATVGPPALLAAGVLYCAVLRWRRACRRAWHATAQVVTLECPPSVSTQGAESLWRYLAQLMRRPWWKRLRFGTPVLAWEYVFTAEGIAIRVWVPGPVPVTALQQAVEATWPGARTRIQEAMPPLPTSQRHRRVLARGGTMRLARPDGLPIKGEIAAWDPLRRVLTAPGALSGGDGACVQILVRPATGLRLARAATGSPPNAAGILPTMVIRWLIRTALDVVTPGAIRSSASPGRGSSAGTRTRDPQLVRESTRQSHAIADKRHGPQCETVVRYAVTTTVPSEPSRDQYLAAQAQLRGRAHTLASSLAGYQDHNYYRPRRLLRPLAALARRDLRRGDLLSTAELAALAHLPEHTAVAGLAQAGAKALPPPIGVARPGSHVKPLGMSTTSAAAPVGLRVADARHHLHVLGATGVGKSTLLAQMILDDIHRHRGTVVLDPKGDLVTDLLARLPKAAAERLVLFDPDQPGAVPCLNPLQVGDRDVAVDQLVSVFRRIFASSWGPRTEDVFRSACLTLRDRAGGATLADLPRLLDDAPFRHRVAVELTDPDLRSFWSWYEGLSEAARAAAIAPLMNKLRSFLLRPFVRGALAGGASVDMGRILDGGICLARLPKGQLGDETTQLFGSLLVAATWQAATARSRIPYARRRDASMVLDEAQNFLNLPYSLEDILAEARGHRFSLTLAHQHLGQLNRDLREGIATNARNKVWFTAGPDDARELARHTTPHLDEHDLAHLGAYTAAARLVVHGQHTRPFTLTTHPLDPAHQGRIGYLRAHAAQATPAQAGTPRSEEPHADSAGEAPPATTSESPSVPSGRPVSEPDEILLDPPGDGEKPPVLPWQAPPRPPGRGPRSSAARAHDDPRR